MSPIITILKARLTSSLIRNCKELEGKLTLIQPEIASESDLLTFHTSAYIESLKVDLDDYKENLEEDEEFGLAYDCPRLNNALGLVLKIAGSSITASKALTNESRRVVVNWYGGWHHAQRDEAQGFCYVNDIALAIQELRKRFDRVLYIDLDVHHGNGVENAFLFTDKVFTFSMHLKELGFFPGTGSLNDVGLGKGKWRNCNVPLKEGASDKSFSDTFNAIFPQIISAFKPEAIVVQCGADSMAKDPLGGFNLSSDAILNCISKVDELKLPTLYLGGGGYVKENAARLWALITMRLSDVEPLPVDIPEQDPNFELFGPSFEFRVDSGMRKDANSQEYLQKVIQTATDNIKNL